MALFYINLLNALLFTAIGAAISLLLIIIGIILLIIGIVKKIKYKKISKKKKYPNVLMASGAVLMCIPFVIVGTLFIDSVVHRLTREKKLTIEERGEIVMVALQNKEKEPIKELFCEVAQNTLNLDNELNGLFNFIDGNIVSYDEPDDWGESLSSTTKGVDELRKGGLISSILTDTGNVYTIYINSYNIYKKDPRFVGLTILNITDDKRYNEENDYPEDAIYSIEIDGPK